jgi:hypothetical protein
MIEIEVDARGVEVEAVMLLGLDVMVCSTMASDSCVSFGGLHRQWDSVVRQCKCQ